MQRRGQPPRSRRCGIRLSAGRADSVRSGRDGSIAGLAWDTIASHGARVGDVVPAPNIRASMRDANALTGMARFTASFPVKKGRGDLNKGARRNSPREAASRPRFAPEMFATPAEDALAVGASDAHLRERPGGRQALAVFDAGSRPSISGRVSRAARRRARLAPQPRSTGTVMVQGTTLLALRRVALIFLADGHEALMRQLTLRLRRSRVERAFSSPALLFPEADGAKPPARSTLRLVEKQASFSELGSSPTGSHDKRAANGDSRTSRASAPGCAPACPRRWPAAFISFEDARTGMLEGTSRGRQQPAFRHQRI